MRAGDPDRGLPGVARPRRDGRQEQRPAGDRLVMRGVLIPGEAAHENEMMTPAVTE